DKTGDAAMRVTIHNCWWVGNERRQPLVRYAWVHLFNNLHEHWGTSSGGGENVLATYNSQLYVENSIFDADVNKIAVEFDGSPWIPVPGNARMMGNVLQNGAQEFERNPGSVFTPSGQYTYTAVPADASLKALIQSEAGWQNASFF
ncbi:MAG: hypothetical protein AAGI12_15960, partial [Pseudomonadota bacterium]